MSTVDCELDISDEVCPMTFVRTKLLLEKMVRGQVVNITLRDGESRYNVPRALIEHGHEVVSLQRLDEDLFTLLVRKSG